MGSVRRLFVLSPLVVAVLLTSHSAVRKDPIGVYGVIDRVVLEPAEGEPERVQLWGVFAIANTFEVEAGEVTRIDYGAFHPVQRGYLYYAVNPEDEGLSRTEWANLQATAGTAEPVAFGSRIPPELVRTRWTADNAVRVAERAIRYNGRLRRADEPPIAPDIFPLRMPMPAGSAAPGLARLPAEAADVLSSGRAAVVYEIVRVPAPISPAAGESVSPGQVHLVARNVADAAVVYFFEIADSRGAKETSPPISPGAKRTSWSPNMSLRDGESYTWRVWVAKPRYDRIFPAAEATFQADG